MDQSKDTLFLIRAKVFDQVARLTAERLKEIGGVRVVVVLDEREKFAETAPFEKISLNERALASIGITGLPENWAWFCGDLCYYLAASHFPGYNYYTLIESDVFLPEAGLEPLLNAFKTCSADAIASQLGPIDEPKNYSKGLAALGLSPAWGCIFPLTRVSGGLLAGMQTLRREALTEASQEQVNDEGVLVGAVQRGGHSIVTLEDLVPAQVSRETFDTNPPHLFEAVVAEDQEIRLFHPVVTFETAIARIRTGEKNYTRHRLRKILRNAPKPMKHALKHALAEAEVSK
jgi:hypothetical protein